MGIFVTVLVGLILRLICIDKAEGLWNDEYMSWMIASQPFTNGFWHSVASQCHMPFYYLYLKFFMNFFGQSDLVLRLTSVFSGVLSVVVMYFTGLEKNKKTAFLLSFFTAISGFLIYYSQEVRIYSLLFLLSAFSLFFTLKALKNPNKKNVSGLIISDVMILLTHTIGFVYVFFQLIYLSFELFKQFKKQIIIMWGVILAVVAGLTPFALKIFTTHTFSQWWDGFTFAKWGYFLTDYFSPCLTNLVSSPEKFFSNITPMFAFWGIVPTIIAVVWLARALANSKQNQKLFGICLGVVFVLTLAAMFGKLVFTTKYSIEIYPMLLYLIAVGALKIDKKLLKISLISVYCILMLGYNFVSSTAAPRARRAQGNKIPAEFIEHAQLKSGDFIILEYYPQDRFEKYIDFSKYNVISINKGNFPEYLSMNMDYQKAYKNGKRDYKQTFMADKNTYFAEKLNKEIISKMKPNQNVLVIMLNGVSQYPPESIKTITSDDILYEKTPLLYLVFSHIKAQVFNTMSENLTLTRGESKGDWSALTFTKLNK